MSSQDKVTIKKIGNLLDEVFCQKNWQGRIGQHQVFLFWNTLVGELSIRAQPDCIRNNILWVSVTDSVWMQQLQFEKQTLLEQINSELTSQHQQSVAATTIPAPQLEDIKFTLNQGTRFAESITTSPQKSACPKRPVNGARLKQFEATANCIDDEELKKSILNLWLAVERRNNPT